MKIRMTALKDTDNDSNNPKMKKQARKLYAKGLKKKAQDPDNDGDKDYSFK